MGLFYGKTEALGFLVSAKKLNVVEPPFRRPKSLRFMCVNSVNLPRDATVSLETNYCILLFHRCAIQPVPLTSRF